MIGLLVKSAYILLGVRFVGPTTAFSFRTQGRAKVLAGWTRHFGLMRIELERAP